MHVPTRDQLWSIHGVGPENSQLGTTVGPVVVPGRHLHRLIF